MKKIIPIFPLDLVLFPRQDLPLRIFEPRYKQLVDDVMLEDGQFGVCLIHPTQKINGWQAPYDIGTIAKIISCKDVDMAGTNLHIDTVGRQKFKILNLIAPDFEIPENYDPVSQEGIDAINKIHEKIGLEKKMYIRAEIELIPEIDESISVVTWENLVHLWKEKTQKLSKSRKLSESDLNAILRQYYLLTDTPTTEYLYSLCALASSGPSDLQPLLESVDLESCILNATKLLKTI